MLIMCNARENLRLGGYRNRSTIYGIKPLKGERCEVILDAANRKKREPILAAMAKERQKRKPADSVVQKSAQQSRTREELAKRAGVGGDTIAKVNHVEATAPEPIKEAARSGEITVNEATKMKEAHNRTL